MIFLRREGSVADVLAEAIQGNTRMFQVMPTGGMKSGSGNKHPRLKALIAEMQAVQNELDFGTAEAERSDRKLKLVA